MSNKYDSRRAPPKQKPHHRIRDQYTTPCPSCYSIAHAELKRHKIIDRGIRSPLVRPRIRKRRKAARAATRKTLYSCIVCTLDNWFLSPTPKQARANLRESSMLSYAWKPRVLLYTALSLLGTAVYRRGSIYRLISTPLLYWMALTTIVLLEEYSTAQGSRYVALGRKRENLLSLMVLLAAVALIVSYMDHGLLKWGW
ncbi:hypothetical protein JX265_005805 [Neoarthrinium moseri]|uniref:Uncharacterized protein n=1 Tax=Neoarthrinium moseri TaxID=1658444 RepID=A0A9P9WNB9_9PEZI|nr:hypothetical protein JX266_009878 [Neoarthrinium moseri]KAI1871819.1 hypothetical protein JX265_005805 [Neoarthrinium moseri]